MVVNTQKLKGKIVEKNTTQENVAKLCNMDRTTFYRKMKKGGDDFTIGEIHSMVSGIPLTREEAMEIFFKQKLQ